MIRRQKVVVLKIKQSGNETSDIDDGKRTPALAGRVIRGPGYRRIMGSLRQSVEAKHCGVLEDVGHPGSRARGLSD